MKHLLPIYIGSIIMTSFLLSCTPAAEPIAYGEDMCSHCKMAIVDAHFAAEVVTQKGKVYKFDAIECMMDFLAVKQADKMAMVLVHDYENPKDWQAATRCNYLISKELPSPMGAGLSAWSSKGSAAAMQTLKGGSLLDWGSLQQQNN